MVWPWLFVSISIFTPLYYYSQPPIGREKPRPARIAHIFQDHFRDCRRAHTMPDYPTLSVTLLGAGQEVGRSCCVLQYRGKTVVLDAGVHLAYNGMASLPFIDELDWSTVDAILITQ